jgi:hypothetical protein
MPTAAFFGNSPHISTFSHCPQHVGVGLASGTWPAANRAYFIPIVLPYDFTVTKLFWLNGSSVGTANVDCAVYSSGDGPARKLISTGSTLSSGALVYQSVSVTATRLRAGIYYMALVLDNTAGTTFRDPLDLRVGDAAGMAMESGAGIPLPSLATPVRVQTNPPPFFMAGMTGRSAL